MTTHYDPADCLHEGVSGTMRSQNGLLKREAEQLATKLQSKYGGRWSATKHSRRGGGYFVVEIQTRQSLEREQALCSARMYLDPDISPFSNSGKGWRSLGFYGQRDRLKADLDKFAAKFAESPLYALEWSTPVIEAAAEYTVICGMIAAHERGVSIEDILSTVENEARRKVEYSSLSRSTSPMSNLCEDAERIAYCKIAKQLRSWCDAYSRAKGNLWAYGEGLA
ncbi:MAG: hypothetical protein KGO96_10385 [Elusimicrobia bacterium]|nr:hypothetical protein [Elusimicrobiota bacterium]